MDEMEFCFGEKKPKVWKELYMEQSGGYRQYSTKYWEVIDSMDQWKVRSFDRPSLGLRLQKKKYDEQDYNVYLYKILPYPPDSKEKQDLLRKFADLPG